MVSLLGRNLGAIVRPHRPVRWFPFVKIPSNTPHAMGQMMLRVGPTRFGQHFDRVVPLRSLATIWSSLNFCRGYFRTRT
jgi:hypothetical protein